MHTERFRQLRKQELTQLLDKKHVSTVWRKIVKDQLRSLDIKDLFDHYDFNYNIEDRVTALKSDILNGTYTVSAPLIYRIEKKFGVCRHLVIPQPIDALLLQILVEGVAPQILKKQPSSNAFYSRDRHNFRLPHEGFEYGVPFRQQWKTFQKRIYQFSNECELLVVTDLSNYFDSVHLEELRKVFVSLVEANEVIVDLLFRVIESISWVPDYLPYSKRGLPTANVEAIRLLAHAFLYEIDAVLKRRTSNSFARWMDDITIGVNSKTDAIALLSIISDMLKSRGLALNLSKTDIYDSDSARFHFAVSENQYLDSLEALEAGTAAARRAERVLKSRFRDHLKIRGARSWSKVSKRYITAFTRLKIRYLLRLLPDLYISHPELRPNLLYFLGGLGYSREGARALEYILENLQVFDDLSLFQIAALITAWQIPRTPSALSATKSLLDRLSALAHRQGENSGFHSMLWVNAKYLSPSDLHRFLRKWRNKWQSNSFLRRQATSCLARILTIEGTESEKLLNEQALSGVQGTVSVANQILQFADRKKLDSRVALYLFPTHRQKVYPLGKFLVLCATLNSESVRNDVSVRRRCLEYVTDPTYRQWLLEQYQIS